MTSRNYSCDEREIDRLIDRMCDQIATADELAKLGRLVVEYPAVQDRYLAALEIHAGLAWRMSPGRQFSPDELLRYGSGASGFGVLGSGREENALPNFALELSPLPLLSTTHYPLSTNFVGGPVFSYMVATVVLCVMLLSAWAYKITHVVEVAGGKGIPSINSPADPRFEFVGHVTGMKDCVWAKGGVSTMVGASVSLGRQYALSSGLMEITYATGARVILEGPCEYTVESPRGGFLAVGRLVARVGAGNGGRATGNDSRSRAPRGNALSRRSASADGQRGVIADTERPGNAFPRRAWEREEFPSTLSPLTSPFFTVRTPTAMVEDLGTEFGVEVAATGETASHVFEGRVLVKIERTRGKGEGREDENNKSEIRNPASEIILSAGQSAWIERENKSGEVKLLTGGKTSSVLEKEKYVRRLREPPKLLDLLDIVAGGNGTGNRRERGIDPSTGIQDRLFSPRYRFGSGQFSPVTWHQLIDGVFVPDGSAGAVQVDSAKHAFDGFPHTDSKAYGSIWARAKIVTRPDWVQDVELWIYAIGNAEQFAPDRRGLLALCPNAGITFNLKAMRKSYPEVRPIRFRAVAGMADARPLYAGADGLAEIWILIDGRLKFHRENIRPTDAPISVDVPLASGDQYLTIVATDGGNGCACDWIVFGDPVLEMGSNDQDASNLSLRENSKEGQ